jgi:hypothetical protein
MENNNQDENAVRDHGLEFIAVFHTIAINTLVRECIYRLGPNGKILAESLYNTWKQSIRDSVETQLNSTKNSQMRDAARHVLNEAMLKVDADIRKTLGIDKP